MELSALVMSRKFTNKKSATSERRVNITFVGEDDVVSEMIPPPAIPVSARKIGACAIDTSLWDESIPDDLEIAEGYRLVSMESLRKFVNRVHTHGPCASGEPVEIFAQCHLLCRKI